MVKARRSSDAISTRRSHERKSARAVIFLTTELQIAVGLGVQIDAVAPQRSVAPQSSSSLQRCRTTATSLSCIWNAVSCTSAFISTTWFAVYSQCNAVFRGAEFQSQLNVAPLAGGTVGVENQFDVVRASFTSGGNVPRIPPVRLGGGLFWRDANWLTRANFLHAFAQNNIALTGEPNIGASS